MNEAVLKELWRELVLSDRIGSIERKELVFCKPADRSLKVYIYSEPNHRRPHIHVYWKKEFEISIAIAGGELLAGAMPRKQVKAIQGWIRKYESNLLQAWSDIQCGMKPELSWSNSA